ncbi:MAG: UDP-N-acetylmuramoyl-tripeptide--D-alanyl-D-alanine ligase, partial [Calditrichae bacterium]|nr:UDP-N-acetylmuramoyl-tripeptide--D-alanyl-D-alanine ligase [Calditrichia bacterium]
ALKAGQFFIPLRGENFDGHEFVRDAVAKKAAAVVVQSDWYSKQDEMNLPQNVTVIVVEDTLDFLQKLSVWHR